MADRHEIIPVPADEDGFISFECPYCTHHFKLLGDECQNDDVVQLFCPACGLPGDPSAFLSSDVREAAQIKAENIAKQMMNDFMKELERSLRGSKALTFKRGRSFQIDAEKVIVEPTDLEHHDLSCCARTVKVASLEKHTGVYCPYCGGMV